MLKYSCSDFSISKSKSKFGNQFFQSMGLLLSCRGEEVYKDNFTLNLKNDILFEKPISDVEILKEISPIGCIDKCVGALANSNSIVPRLENLLSNINLKLNSNAYLHHYQKHKVDLNDWKEGLETIEQIISNYKYCGKFHF